jgi:hypothetical protein
MLYRAEHIWLSRGSSSAARDFKLNGSCLIAIKMELQPSVSFTNLVSGVLVQRVDAMSMRDKESLN